MTDDASDPSPLPPPRPYRVRRRIEWRVASDGNLEMDDPRDGGIVRFTPWTEPLLGALNDGVDYTGLAERFPASAGDARARELRARRLVLQFHRLGHLDIPLETPPLLNARYRPQCELGRGAMGVAWLCRDLRREDTLVVKTAWDFLTPRELAEDALRHEADMLRRLEGAPGVPRLRETFVHDARLHIARDFVAGEDLRRHQRNPIEDAQEARRLVAQAARVVHAAHERGLLLFDLGPGNFLRTAAGGVALLDVGLARPLAPGADEFRLERAVGAPGFLAPELLREGRASVRGEVWALGALYAFLRTGLPPPKNGDLAPLLERLGVEERRVVERLCAVEPAARPASTHEAATLLTAVLQS